MYTFFYKNAICSDDIIMNVKVGNKKKTKKNNEIKKKKIKSHRNAKTGNYADERCIIW